MSIPDFQTIPLFFLNLTRNHEGCGNRNKQKRFEELSRNQITKLIFNTDLKVDIFAPLLLESAKSVITFNLIRGSVRRAKNICR